MLTQNDLRKTASSLVFNPKKPGPLKILADVNNLDFYKHRAILSIHEDNLEDAARCLLIAMTHGKQESGKTVPKGNERGTGTV